MWWRYGYGFFWLCFFHNQIAFTRPWFKCLGCGLLNVLFLKDMFEIGFIDDVKIIHTATVLIQHSFVFQSCALILPLFLNHSSRLSSLFIKANPEKQKSFFFLMEHDERKCQHVLVPGGSITNLTINTSQQSGKTVFFDLLLSNWQTHIERISKSKHCSFSLKSVCLSFSLYFFFLVRAPAELFGAVVPGASSTTCTVPTKTLTKMEPVDIVFKFGKTKTKETISSNEGTIKQGSIEVIGDMKIYSCLLCGYSTGLVFWPSHFLFPVGAHEFIMNRFLQHHTWSQIWNSFSFLSCTKNLFEIQMF